MNTAIMLRLLGHKTLQFFPSLLPRLECQEMLGTWPVRTHFLVYRNKLWKQGFTSLTVVEQNTKCALLGAAEDLQREKQRPHRGLQPVRTFRAEVEDLS